MFNFRDDIQRYQQQYGETPQGIGLRINPKLRNADTQRGTMMPQPTAQPKVGANSDFSGFYQNTANIANKIAEEKIKKAQEAQPQQQAQQPEQPQEMQPNLDDQRKRAEEEKRKAEEQARQAEEQRKQAEERIRQVEELAKEQQKTVEVVAAETGQEQQYRQAQQTVQDVQQQDIEAFRKQQGILNVEDAPITQHFGNKSSVEKYSGGVNYGTDFGVPKGTTVALPSGIWRVEKTFTNATAEGTGNAQQSINAGYGNSVLTENVDTGEEIRYSHLSPGGVKVKEGQELPGGTVIGETGATGNVAGATGEHLDVEYYNADGKISDIMKTNYAKELIGIRDMNPEEMSVISGKPEVVDPEIQNVIQPVINERAEMRMARMGRKKQSEIKPPTPEESNSVAGNAEAFIELYKPFALKIEEETGVPYKLTLAQAGLESGWGQSTPGFNYFGIKGEGSAGSQILNTTENFGQGTVPYTDKFRAYNSPEESFRDHAKLLTENPVYENVVQSFATGNDEAIAQAIHQSPYATDSRYFEKIYNLMKLID